MKFLSVLKADEIIKEENYYIEPEYYWKFFSTRTLKLLFSLKEENKKYLLRSQCLKIFGPEANIVNVQFLPSAIIVTLNFINVNQNIDYIDVKIYEILR